MNTWLLEVTMVQLVYFVVTFCLSPIIIIPGISSLMWPSLFQVAVFCPSKTSSSPDSSARGEFSAETHMHCLVLLLRKENACHHIPALVKGNISTAQQPGKRRVAFQCM